MGAFGGEVRAKLILDSSGFKQGWQKEVKDINAGLSGINTSPAQKAMQNLENSTGNVKGAMKDMGSSVIGSYQAIGNASAGAAQKISKDSAAGAAQVRNNFQSMNRGITFTSISSSFEAAMTRMSLVAKSTANNISSSLRDGIGATDYMATIFGTMVGGQLWDYGMSRATTQQLLSSKGSAGNTMYEQYKKYTIASSTSDADINRMFQYVMNSPGMDPNLTYRGLGAINAAAYSPDPVQRYRDMLAYGRYFQGGWDNAGKALLDEGLSNEQIDMMKAAKTPEERAAALESIAKTRGAMNEYGQDISTLTTGPMANFNKVLVIADTLMRGMTQGFTNLLNAISPVLDWFIKLDTGTQNLIGQFVFFIGSGLVAASVLGILIQFMSPLYGGVLLVAKSFVTLVTGMTFAEMATVGVSLTLKELGASLIALALNPITLVVAALAALAVGLYIAGEHFGWFKSGAELAGEGLNKMKGNLDAAKQSQSNAQQEVNKWTATVNKSKPGTEGYATATSNLKNAKSALATATANAAIQEQIYKNAQDETSSLTVELADKTLRLAKATIAYRVAVGELKPEEGVALGKQASDAAATVDLGQGKMREQIKGIDAKLAALEKAGITEVIVGGKGTGEYVAGPSTPTGRPELGRSAAKAQDLSTATTAQDWWSKQIGWAWGDLWFGSSDYPLTGEWQNKGSLKGLSEWVGGGIAPYLTDPTQLSLILGKSTVDALYGGGGLSPVSAAGGEGGKAPSMMDDINRELENAGITLPQIDVQGWISTNITGPISQLPGQINQYFTDAFNNASNIVSTDLNNIGQFFWNLPMQIQGALQNTYNSITTWIGNAVNTARSWVQNAINGISGAFWGLVGQAGAAWNAVYNAVRGPIDWIVGKVNQLRNLIGGGSMNATASTMGLGVGVVGRTSGLSAGPGPGIFDNTGGMANQILNGVDRMSQSFFGGNILSDPFGAFMNFATKLFSGYHYQFYYGNRQNSLQTHEGNCMDLADALMSIASVFGLKSGETRGFWNGIPHHWTNIGGRALDPTAFVLGHGWSPPSQRAGNTSALGVGAGPGGIGTPKEVHLYLHEDDKIRKVVIDLLDGDDSYVNLAI